MFSLLEGIPWLNPNKENPHIIDTINNMQFKSIGDTIITFPENENNKNNLQNLQKNKINFLKKSHQNLKNLSSFITEKENLKLTMRLSSTFRNHALYVSKLKDFPFWARAGSFACVA